MMDRILRNHAFTRGLGDQQIAALAELATAVSFEADELILVEGQRSKCFYLITDGSVAVELRSPTFVVCVQALAPGHVFGWSALLEDHDTLFQVRARERTAALRLNGAALRAACLSDTLLGTELLQRTLKVVAGRVRAIEMRFAEMCGVRVWPPPPI
jgi:CRP-like cAMP-binding protein